MIFFNRLLLLAWLLEFLIKTYVHFVLWFWSPKICKKALFVTILLASNKLRTKTTNLTLAWQWNFCTLQGFIIDAKCVWIWNKIEHSSFGGQNQNNVWYFCCNYVVCRICDVNCPWWADFFESTLAFGMAIRILN